MLNVGESYVAADGNQYQCVHGSDGGVRLQFTESINTQAITLCTYNGTTFAGGETVESGGALFNCTKKGDHFEWEWKSGGECKLNDNLTLATNQEKRVGNATYRCVARRLKIVITVKGRKL